MVRQKYTVSLVFVDRSAARMVQFIWGVEQKRIERNVYRMTGLTAPCFLRGVVGRSKIFLHPTIFIFSCLTFLSSVVYL